MGKKSQDKAAAHDREAQSAIAKARLSSKDRSPFVQKTTALYLALSPVAYHFPLKGLVAEHISPSIMTYFRPLNGVLMAFSNPRISEHPLIDAQATNDNEVHAVLTRSVDESAVTYVWLTAEFVLFQPGRDSILEGDVNVSNEGMLGLVCYNYFNAGIERSRLPSEWEWNGVNWVDGNGQMISGKQRFKVIDMEVSGEENVTIKGSMLDVDSSGV